MALRIKSDYMSLTGCPFLFYEFKRMLPLLMDPEADRLVKEEVQNNQILQINSPTSRDRFAYEFKRRYASLPESFWKEWMNWSEEGQRLGLFYAILKTYKLAFDIHFNATIKKWNSVDPSMSKAEVLMEMNEIASHEPYVDSWSDKTKSRSADNYITNLRQAGLMAEKSNELKCVHLSDCEAEYFIRTGEEWFLTASLMKQYEINDLKERLK